MKKKILLTLLMVAMLTVVFALAISARAPQREDHTYNYYDEGGKLLYSATTRYAIDRDNKNIYEFEMTVRESEMSFSKTDKNGAPLTWFVLSDDKDSDGDYVTNIVVACAPTASVGSINASGQFTYNDTVVNGVTVTAKNVVSANFFGMNIVSFPNAYFMATATNVPGGKNTQYCQMTDGSYLLALYLPQTMVAIPDQFCQRSAVRVVEFENGKIAEKQEIKCSSANSSYGGPFAYCSNLKAISIPENVTAIESMSFRECLGLKYVKFPSTMTRLENSVFEYVAGIETLVLGPQMTFAGYLCWDMQRFYLTTVLEGVGARFYYVPNTINTPNSQFDAFRGKEKLYVSTAFNDLTFFFAGSLDEAKTVAAYTDSYLGIAAGVKTKTGFKQACAPITYETYLTNPEYYNSLKGQLLVYDVPTCVAFYDGVHIEGEISALKYESGFAHNGICTIACVRKGCGLGYESEYAPIVTPKGYAVTEATSGLKASITSGFAINGEVLELYERVNGVSLEIGLAMTGVGEDSALREADTMTLGDFRATKALKTEAGFAYASVDYRVNLSADNQKDLQIIVCLYLSVGDNIELIQSKDTGVAMAGGLQLVSYNHIYKIYG